MKITRKQLKRIIKEELLKMSQDYRWGKPRKNIKRRDPRYFLNETVNRDRYGDGRLDEISQQDQGTGLGDLPALIEAAILKALDAGRHYNKENPLSMLALFGENGAILQYMKEMLKGLGADERKIQTNLKLAHDKARRTYMKPAHYGDGVEGKHTLFHTPDGGMEKIAVARGAQGRPDAGEEGLYIMPK